MAVVWIAKTSYGQNSQRSMAGLAVMTSGGQSAASRAHCPGKLRQQLQYNKGIAQIQMHFRARDGHGLGMRSTIRTKVTIVRTNFKRLQGGAKIKFWPGFLSSLPLPPKNMVLEWRKETVHSNNREGSSFCSWHKDRRSDRVYAPRSAPPGLLSCGCTGKQALFEEALARHGVPRLNAGVRNALLKLLEKTYRYSDGDFDESPTFGFDATMQQSVFTFLIC